MLFRSILKCKLLTSILEFLAYFFKASSIFGLFAYLSKNISGTTNAKDSFFIFIIALLFYIIGVVLSKIEIFLEKKRVFLSSHYDYDIIFVIGIIFLILSFFLATKLSEIYFGSFFFSGLYLTFAGKKRLGFYEKQKAITKQHTNKLWK